jgi:hypothetical protein
MSNCWVYAHCGTNVDLHDIVITPDLDEIVQRVKTLCLSCLSCLGRDDSYVYGQDPVICEVSKGRIVAKHGLEGLRVRTELFDRIDFFKREVVYRGEKHPTNMMTKIYLQLRQDGSIKDEMFHNVDARPLEDGLWEQLLDNEYSENREELSRRDRIGLLLDHLHLLDDNDGEDGWEVISSLINFNRLDRVVEVDLDLEPMVIKRFNEVTDPSFAHLLLYCDDEERSYPRTDAFRAFERRQLENADSRDDGLDDLLCEKYQYRSMCDQICRNFCDQDSGLDGSALEIYPFGHYSYGDGFRGRLTPRRCFCHRPSAKDFS